ncbi:MAG: MFS transporter [Chloroflexi bacterium]|nr:MFS transporter [Chloroflexota bacterium]
MSHPRRWLTLTIVCFAMLMNTLDQTIVNVALPAIQRDLQFDQASLAWVVDAYLIAFGGSLLLAGRLGDLVGRRKIFLAGLALFTVMSGVCGFADSQMMLIAARFAQGVGAALSSSVIIAIIVTEFHDMAERAKAMSAYIVVAVGGGSIGLLLGGFLTQTVGWHWNFFINLPIGLATMIAGRALLRENEGLGFEHGLDVAGSVLATAGPMLGIYAIVESNQAGWLAPQTIAAGGAALLLIPVFLALQARLRSPIMPLHVFQARGLLASSFVRGLTMVGMYATFFLGALYLEHVAGYDTIHTGLAFLPMTLTVLALSLGITTRVMAFLGPKRTVLAGLVVMLSGLVLFTRVGLHSSYVPFLGLIFLLVGLGSGTLFTPLLTIAVADVPMDDAGLASGIINVSQNVAAAFGIAVLGTISSAYSQGLLQSGSDQLTALNSGFQIGFVAAAAAVACALLLTVTLLRTDTTRRQQELPDELAVAA